MADAQPAMSEPSTPTPMTASTKKMPASTTWPTAPSPGPIGMATRTRRYGSRATAGASWKIRRSAPGGHDVFLLRELHAVGDELGPAVEAARVHRAEAALHVGHHLVLGLADDQREDEEDDEDDEKSQGDVERVVHCEPPEGLSGVEFSGPGSRGGRFGRLGGRSARGLRGGFVEGGAGVVPGGVRGAGCLGRW